MNRELLWVDALDTQGTLIAMQSGYTRDRAVPLRSDRMMQFSRPEWCEARNAPVSELPRDALRLHNSGRDHCGITNADASVMREPVLAALAAISELPLSAVISHDWAWSGERNADDPEHPDKQDAAALAAILTEENPDTLRQHIRNMEQPNDATWMRLFRFADDAQWLMKMSLQTRDPDGRRLAVDKPLLIPALAYFAHFATERLASERTAYQQRRAALDDQINTVAAALDKNIKEVARTKDGDDPDTLMIIDPDDPDTMATPAIRNLLPLCAQFISLVEPPEATQWALDLAWRVGVTDYAAKQPLLTEQANEATLRAEVLRRLPEEISERWGYRINEGDLSAALASVGAVDHPDTPERYLAKVRVCESGEAERERLRQQVAKFSA